MTGPNTSLLLRTLEHIETHPEEWVQSSWRCDTVMCFAGHAATIDGGQWATHRVDTSHLIERPGDRSDREYGAPEGMIHAADRARHILGLDCRQADALFDSDNTLDDLRAHVYRLTGQWDKLAALAEDAASWAAANRSPRVSASSLADPSIDHRDVGYLWDDLVDTIRRWRKASDADKPERRAVVEDAVRALIGGAR